MVRTRQSSRKRQKLSDREQNMPSIDRLSGLPDSVICHILSFLPTKLSVATNILARRWRFLWADVPNLDFDCRNHDTKAKYSDIINRVMLLHKVQNLNTFCLSFMDPCSAYQLKTWIATAIMRHVQKLDLHLCYQVRLPKCLFTCKTLVDLRLRGCVGILYVEVICLPCLKKLELSSIQYEEDDVLPHLLSGCPVLEELIIDKIMEQDLVCCSIVSPSIKRLIVDFQFDKYQLYSYGSYNHEYKLKINAPALRYLHVEDCLSENFSAQMLTSLIEADISFRNYKEVEDDSLYTSSVLNFVDSLCNVKCLKLSSGKMVDKELKHWMEPFEPVPKCLSSHLRTITIDQFGCAKHEFNMVRYILRNAKVLKMMEIYSQSRGISLKAKFDALKRISLFQRRSACKLAFH